MPQVVAVDPNDPDYLPNQLCCQILKRFFSSRVAIKAADATK